MFTYFLFLLSFAFVNSNQEPAYMYLLNGTSNILFAKPADNQEAISVKPQKKLLVSLPFVHAKRYLFEIITDKPYIPREALRIKLAQTSWYIWRDEQSIRYIKVVDGEPQSREDRLPKPLISVAQITGILCAEFSTEAITLKSIQ
jgi:hypothetical protein